MSKTKILLHSLYFLSALAVLQFGCDSRSSRPTRQSARQSRLENEKEKKEFEAELQETMQKTELMFEPYRTNGLLKVKMTPENGEVYVEDGVVTIPTKGLMLPVGTYDVKVVWPDGKQTSKKVFLTPALQHTISYDWKYSSNSNDSSGKKDFNISANADLSPTEVTFVKPKE